MEKDSDLKVFISYRESTCGECKENLGHHAWITLDRNRGALCLSCADIDHLAFLPSGDAALSRRARKHSVLSAVVLKWSRARKHYERQGLLVEEQALEQAERECLADSDIRARRRQREIERRAETDSQYMKDFAMSIRELFPGCPKGREMIIAEHACLKYSGRVGRSSSAKNFDPDTVRLAVIAHIRHAETKYDTLIAKGYDRSEARALVRDVIDSIMLKWETS
ncbi:MAG TPA: DUF2293 domain-containing protein [archaeon]|nr:DUF2293 domain-containing protein [archaeon]